MTTAGVSRRVVAGRGLRVAALASLAMLLLALPVHAQERPKTSSSVQAPAQGGGGAPPVAGAPPAAAPAAASRPARATLAPAPSRPASDEAASLRAVALVEGEGTVELDGVRQDIRPGSRLGDDTVRSVAPGRIVLERRAPAGAPGGRGLVIVTFDEAGKARAQVFWTRDPARPAEAKRP